MAQLQERRAAAPRAKKPQLEEKLRTRRTELGEAQDKLFGVQREVALSTIKATLLEKTPAPAQGVPGLRAAWQAFTVAAVKLGIGLVWVGLFGLLAAPFIALGTYLYRRRSSQ